MGKYTRKAKISGEMAVMDVSHHEAPGGVRTRARTLSAAATDSSLCYLELRSRRLEKPAPPGPTSTSGKCKGVDEANPQTILGSRSAVPTLRMHSGSVRSASRRSFSSKGEGVAETTTVDWAPDVEASSGDNVLDFEDRERCARETTPCSLIMDSEMIGTPSSTTRPRNPSARNQRRNSINPNIPTSQDMEEFFANSEQLQQQDFQEKYNFDFANEYPLSGRYEWVKNF
ncbi:hypothetical protein Cni_G07460 [Canna indica]|uniref:Cyclin-dependent kinase inhibitor domain-containing protein n=1 Tax=Canna indica TaxID=4628 RepID=A0AAQ3JYS5_9LILI|nr:hypothetical protein Cni_G07460 [Canna indica]